MFRLSYTCYFVVIVWLRVISLWHFLGLQYNFFEESEHIPAKDNTRKLRMEYMCCRPKSLTWVHQRRNNLVNDVIVDR